MSEFGYTPPKVLQEISGTQQPENLPSAINESKEASGSDFDFSFVLPSQRDEVERLYYKLTDEYRAEHLDKDVFKIRVEKAQQLIAELSELDALAATEGREFFAQNSKTSLENFIIEEVIEYGADTNALKEQVVAEYKNVQAHHRVTVNFNYKSLPGMYKHGGLKSYEEVGGGKRERGMFGATNYGKRRSDRDESLSYGVPFVVGALAAQNEYDEVLGVAPFYGHGAATLKPELVAQRVKFYEGDSMTNEKTAEEVTPRWLARKWALSDSRKLDEKGAFLSKALMELSCRNRGFTHVHLVYVEAHIMGGVAFDDMEAVTYAVDVDDWRKRELEEQAKSEDKDRQAGAKYNLNEMSFNHSTRDFNIEKVNELWREQGRSLQIEVKHFNKEINPKPERWNKANQKIFFTLDNGF